MKKYFIFLYLFFIATVLLRAQQSAQFTQNIYTQLLTNPGYAGSEGQICAYALNRTQWQGFEGAPSVTVFNVDAAIKRFGLGLSLENDALGFDNNLKVNLSIAYKHPFGNGNLGIGVKWGIANSALDLGNNGWITPNGEGVENDLAIPNESSNALSFLDFGFGLYYKTQDLYLGISSTQLNEAEFDYVRGSYKLKRHYYIMAGYVLPFANPLLEFKPNVFVQSDGANTQLAVNGIIEYNKKLWGGVSLRTDNAISGIFGVELFKWVKVSYSYDFVVSDLIGYNNGTHEIMMGFRLDVKKDKTPEKYKSIRFL